MSDKENILKNKDAWLNYTDEWLKIRDAPLFYNQWPVKTIEIGEEPMSDLSGGEKAELVLFVTRSASTVLKHFQSAWNRFCPEKPGLKTGFMCFTLKKEIV